MRGVEKAESIVLKETDKTNIISLKVVLRVLVNIYSVRDTRSMYLVKYDLCPNLDIYCICFVGVFGWEQCSCLSSGSRQEVAMGSSVKNINVGYMCTAWTWRGLRVCVTWSPF